MFDFRAPLFLNLLAAIPVLILVQTTVHISVQRSGEKARPSSLGVRHCCVRFLALADLHSTHKEQRLAVVFLIDTSESIPSTQHEAALIQINAAVAKLKPTDQFGIIGFARETAVLRDIRPKQDLAAEDTSAISLETLREQTLGRDGTDVLTALKRAIALLPDDYHRRIVLFSDGMHNAGGTSLKDYLPLLAASKVEILTVPAQRCQGCCSSGAAAIAHSSPQQRSVLESMQ